MKNTFLLTFLILFSVALHAQEKTDVLMLKNGSIIRGKIIESDAYNVKVLSANNLLVFMQTDIDKQYKEVAGKSNRVSERGRYFNVTTMGVLVGSSANRKTAPVSVLMEHNFRFNDYFSMGGVFGFEFLNETVCPVALNLKAYIPLNSNDIFIDIASGYSISTENIGGDYYSSEIDGTGGYLLNLELGYLAALSKNTGVYLAAGYRYNELNYKMENWMYDNVDRKIYFHRISFRMGITLF